MKGRASPSEETSGVIGEEPPDWTPYHSDILRYLHLVPYVARKFPEDGLREEDMEQEGVFGLVNGLSHPDYFDPSKGTIEGYLRGCIRNKIRDAIRKVHSEFPVTVSLDNPVGDSTIGRLIPDSKAYRPEEDPEYETRGFLPGPHK